MLADLKGMLAIGFWRA